MVSIERRSEKSFRLIVENGYDDNGKRDRKKKSTRIEDPKILKSKRKLQEYLEDQLDRFRIKVEAYEYIAPEKSTVESFAVQRNGSKRNSLIKMESLTLLQYLLSIQIT